MHHDEAALAVGVQYEAPHFIYNDQPWLPRIDLSQNSDQAASFNACLIRVEGGSFCHVTAAQALAAGQLLVWELPLAWTLPLAEARAALQHFCEQLGAPWRQHTAGILILNTTVARLTSEAWAWLPEGHFEDWCTLLGVLPTQQLRDHHGVALIDIWAAQVTTGLPDEPPCLACLDARACADTAAFYQLTQRARCERLHLFWRPPQADCVCDLAWEEGIAVEGFMASKPLAEPIDYQIALCLPQAFCLIKEYWEDVRMALQQLTAQSIIYRPLAEERLALSWQGLEVIVVVSAALSSLGRRQLEGFAAAGGTVVTIGALLGLPAEEPFTTWLVRHNKAPSW